MNLSLSKCIRMGWIQLLLESKLNQTERNIKLKAS